MELIRCQPDRNRSWRSWLITVAQREAWRLHAKEAGHVGFEVGAGEELAHEPVDHRDVLTLRDAVHAALDLLAAVPERRRQVKALQVTGLTYAEIGGELGLSYTRVNQLLVEANAARRVAARGRHQHWFTCRRQGGRQQPHRPREQRPVRRRSLGLFGPARVVDA